MKGVTYDAGALIAAERRSNDVWKVHNMALEGGVEPVVPAGVLAQVWRGGSGRQVPLARMLRQCRVEPLEEELAKQVGMASQRSGTSDVVDLSVVVGAIRRGDILVTGDAEDMSAIASTLGRKLTISPV